MKRKVYISFIALLFVITSSNMGRAQAVQFTASAKKVVAIGERFRLIYQVNAEGSNFQPPYLDDFSVLSGPSVSTSSSIQIINGNVSQSVSNSYTYILEGVKEGKFTIKPARITVNGKVYNSNELEIEVVKTQASAQSSPQNTQQGTQQGQAQQQQPNTQSATLADSDLFIRVEMSKRNVYVGEPIVATIKIYTTVPLHQFKDTKFPNFQGFYSQTIEEPQQITLERENVNGRIYEAGLLKKLLLYPQKTGKLEIDAMELGVVYLRQEARRHFFDDGIRAYETKLKSPKVTVNVQPLPSPKPEGFTNAIGNFKYSFTADKTTVKANEAITFKQTISGTGNLKLLEPIKPEFHSDFEVYDPKVHQNLKNTINGTTGNITSEYLVIPRHDGSYTIPAMKFSFFDPGLNKYSTITTSPIQITVEKSEGGAPTQVIQGYTKEDFKFLGKDINYIKTGNISLRKQDAGIQYGSITFWAMYAVPFLILIFIVIVRRQKIKESQNLAKLKNKQANKVSKKRLKKAQEMLKNNNLNAFYEEVMKAMWGYVSDKLSIPVAELNKDNVRDSLMKKGADEQLVQEFLTLLDTCEFSRFAPSASPQTPEQLYVNASHVIQQLENKIS
ncbi:MAG: BatD family protein [Bacteroidales bacterium]